MPVAAAIVGGLGAGGSIISSLISSNAAQQASQQQVALGEQSLATQQNIFGQGLDWAKQLYGNVSGAVQPVLASGESAMNSALPTLQKLLTPGPDQTQTLSQLPGFQFAQNWGQTAARNQGTTSGLGGNTIAAGADYATGLAQQGFSGLAGLLQNLYTSGSNTATSALGTLGSAAGSSASTVGNLSSNAMSSLGSTLTGIGQSQAAGTLGSANAISGGITGATGAAGNAFLLNALFSKFGNQNQNQPVGTYSGTPSSLGGQSAGGILGP